MPQSERISHAQRTEASDASMLETAVRLITEQGTTNTTLKDVGELAGYSRGLAGYRFGNKAGLFEFVFRSVAAQWLESLTAATAGKVGYEAIVAAIDAHYQYCADTPFYFSAFYTLWFESIGPESVLQDVVSNIHQRRARDVAAWIEAGIQESTIDAGVDANEVANFFCAMIVGIVYQWLLNPNDLNAIEALYNDLKKTMHTKLVTPK